MDAAGILAIINAARAGLAYIKDEGLRIQVHDLITQAEALTDEIKQLNKLNQELCEKLNRRQKIIKDGNTFYVIEDDGTLSAPTCPMCYQKDGIAYSLQKIPRGARCEVCGNVYPGSRASTQELRQRFL